MNVVSDVDLLGAAAGIINLFKTYNISKGKQYVITGLNCKFFYPGGVYGGSAPPPWIFNYCVSQKINIFILILKTVLGTKYSEFYQQIKV